MVVIVVCHTILNDAFRNYSDVSPEKLKEQESSKFILRYLIEVKDNKSIVALTSEQVMESLASSLPNQGVGGYPAQIILALRNLIYTLDSRTSDLNESVTIISDLLSSKLSGVRLISNMPKKKLKVIEYYQRYRVDSKKIKEENIPFIILTACDLEEHLREINPEACKFVDGRLKE